ncbi:hypothetical protein AB0D38_41270, partial [Streptomyces sp. NPDC048279]|uniref:hypothetical protein n=1 Tax=Streptomyces sp. NPDC048279 TaxID=3154714 RepID=UPI00342405C6
TCPGHRHEPWRHQRRAGLGDAKEAYQHAANAAQYAADARTYAKDALGYAADAAKAAAAAQASLARTIGYDQQAAEDAAAADKAAGNAEGYAKDARDSADADALQPAGHVSSGMERRLHARAEARVRAALGDDAAYEAAYAEGGGLSLAEATALL